MSWSTGCAPKRAPTRSPAWGTGGAGRRNCPWKSNGPGAAAAACRRPVDLDRFKQLDDTAGHRAGDQLLQAVAQGFATHLRAADLVPRIGGDEFATALPDTTADTARAALERLRTSLPSGATCSVGLALWDGLESADGLVQRADDALYRAKTEGRDRLVID